MKMTFIFVLPFPTEHVKDILKATFIFKVKSAAMFTPILTTLIACKPAPSGDDDEVAHRRAVLEAVHRDVVAAEYEAFATAAEVLETKTAELCASPSQATLDEARTAFDAARAPWKRMEVVGFGPVVDEPYRYGPLIDFWPVRDTVVDDLLDGESAVDLATIQTLGASTRGFPVLDYLLWHPTVSVLDDARHCTYTASVAADLHDNATGLHDAWLAYAPKLEDPSAQTDFAYATQQQVIDEWVNRLLFAIDDIRAEKLGKPAGDGSQGNPLPDAVESRYSARSLLDARDAFAGIELLYDGRGADADDGLGALLTPERTPIGYDESFAAAREAARDALAAIPETLEQTVQQDTSTIVAAQQALREVQVLIQVDLAQALGVTLAFNDNDGD